VEAVVEDLSGPQPRVPLPAFQSQENAEFRGGSISARSQSEPADLHPLKKRRSGPSPESKLLPFRVEHIFLPNIS